MPLAATPAAPETPLEYRVKAAFLYHFGQFVEWPDERVPMAGEPFVVGVLGDDPFGPALDETLNGKSLAGRGLRVHRARSVDDLNGSRILYISPSEDAKLGEILAAVPDGVLTVGDSVAFRKAGGMVGFVLRNEKVSFEIDLPAAERAGLKLSSRLLSVASAVKTK